MILRMFWIVLACYVYRIAAQVGQAHDYDSYTTDDPEVVTFTGIVCEGDTFMTECEDGETLRWQVAEYKTPPVGGRCFSNTTVPPKNCQLKDVKDIIRQSCNGTNMCTFTVDDSFVNGDPCDGVYQTVLEVTYTCSEKVERKSAVCDDNNQRTIRCPNGTMSVISAVFKTDIKADDCGTTGFTTVDCLQNATEFVNDRCSGHPSCTFDKFSDTFGSPCADVFHSQFEYRYLCLGSGQEEPVTMVTVLVPDCKCVNERTPGTSGRVMCLEICGSDNRERLKYLTKVLVTAENVQDVADALADIIEDSNENSETVDIADVEIILHKVVNIRSSSPNVTDCVIRAVNAILFANISSSDQESSNASSHILQSFERQVSYTINQHGKYSSTRPNIAVEVVTVRETQLRRGIGFTVGQTDAGFSEDKSRSYDPDEAESVDISIQLPQHAIFGYNNESEARVSFIGYNEDKLFQSELLEDLNATMVVGPILSAAVIGRKVANLDEPVILQIETKVVEEVDPKAFKCVYWDFSKRDGIGDWAEDGCELISAESGKITCQCNHLTNFAVLVDFSGQHGTHNFVLDIISKVGCASSIVGLGLTIMIFLRCRGLRMSLQRKILIQFCMSMLGLYFVFLIGIDSTDSNAGCIIVAALLHFFVVTTVLWMGVEARHMYITLVSESERVSRKFLIRAGIFAWGGGLIPVVIGLAVKQRQYIAESYCFLAPDYGLFFGLLLPIGCVILHNIITFGLVTKKLMSSRSYLKKSDLENFDNKADDGKDLQKTGVTEVPQRLLNAFAVSILLGITWVFGFLAVEEARFAFQLLFCIFNSFQGVLIFVLFCYAQKDVRKIVCGKCFLEPPSQPAVKKVKKPAATGATLVSNDTRLTGESYTEDNDTLVTSVNGMTMTALQSEAVGNDGAISQEDPIKTVIQKSTDVEEPKATITKSHKNGVNKNKGSNPEPVTEETVVSEATNAHNTD